MRSGLLIVSLWIGLSLAAAAAIAPALNPIGNKQVKVGELLAFNLSAVNPDNSPIFFSATDLPSNAALNPGSGYFNWIPESAQVGTHRFTFIVSDNSSPNQTSSETVVFQVNSNTDRTRITDFPLVFPSPYSSVAGGGITLQYTLSQSVDIDVIIFNSLGQIVKKILVYSGNEGGRVGLNKLAWDAITDLGMPISNGIYIAAIVDKGTQSILGKIKLVVAQ